MRTHSKQVAARPPGMTMAEPSPQEVADARRRADSGRPPALHLDAPPAPTRATRSDLPLWTAVAIGLVLIAGVIAYAVL